MARLAGPAQPMTLAELQLPPSLVSDHCIRTLSYQGPMSAVELARHWRVHPDIASEVVEALKTAGLAEAEAGQTTYERLGRVRLTASGHAQIAAARQRTWYAGPLPVALAEFYALMRSDDAPMTSQGAVRAALAPFFFDQSCTDELGQAIAGGAAVALAGAAYDEQAEVAGALGSALIGETLLPYALFGAGALIRVFDPRMHGLQQQRRSEDETDILRSHDSESRWLSVRRPVAVIAGGVFESDVVPAYDQDARLYVAPAPFRASGGLLAVLDSDCNPAAIEELVRLWLIPGRTGAGIIRLRSGERIDVPWRAATVLFERAASSLPQGLRDALVYAIDVSALHGGALRAFVTRRLLNPEVFSEDAIDALAGLLERGELATRAAAALAARYLRERSAYAGAAFQVEPGVLQQAVHFAGAALRRQAGLAKAA